MVVKLKDLKFQLDINKLKKGDSISASELERLIDSQNAKPTNDFTEKSYDNIENNLPAYQLDNSQLDTNQKYEPIETSNLIPSKTNVTHYSAENILRYDRRYDDNDENECDNYFSLYLL